MSGPMQWTPNGLVPAMTMTGGGTIGAAAPQPLDALDDDDADDASVPEAPRRPVPRPAKGAPAKPLKARSVVQMARSRLVEIERELKRMRRLERERDELRRLVDAAKSTPKTHERRDGSVVRDLPKRSAG